MKKRKVKIPSGALVPFAPSFRPLLPSGRKAEKEFIAYRLARKIDGTKEAFVDLLDFITRLRQEIDSEKAYLEERLISIQNNEPENIDQIQARIYRLEGVVMKEALVINHPLVKGRNLPTETESKPKKTDVTHSTGFTLIQGAATKESESEPKPEDEDKNEKY